MLRAALVAAASAAPLRLSRIFGLFPREPHIQDFWGPVSDGFKATFEYEAYYQAMSDDEVGEAIDAILAAVGDDVDAEAREQAPAGLSPVERGRAAGIGYGLLAVVAQGERQIAGILLRARRRRPRRRRRRFGRGTGRELPLLRSRRRALRPRERVIRRSPTAPWIPLPLACCRSLPAVVSPY